MLTHELNNRLPAAAIFFNMINPIGNGRWNSMQLPSYWNFFHTNKSCIDRMKNLVKPINSKDQKKMADVLLNIMIVHI